MDDNTLIDAYIVSNSVVIWDYKDATTVYNLGFFGKPIGIGKVKPGDILLYPLQLSLFDALYLLERNKIRILKENKELTREEFIEFGNQNYKRFEEKYIVYEDLRKKGYIPRAGMKFGVDFVVYKKGPGIDHSPFMVHIEHDHLVIDPILLLRAGRLATSVKKKFITAIVSKGYPKYYVFNRFKP